MGNVMFKCDRNPIEQPDAPAVVRVPDAAIRLWEARYMPEARKDDAMPAEVADFLKGL